MWSLHRAPNEVNGLFQPYCTEVTLCSLYTGVWGLGTQDRAWSTDKGLIQEELNHVSKLILRFRKGQSAGEGPDLLVLYIGDGSCRPIGVVFPVVGRCV